jgi:signal transduction histidine kinase
MRGGLEIIETRAEGLNQFMQSYARLAKLPAPTKQAFEVAPLLRRVVALETRSEVEITPGPEVTINADAAQLEQVIINLVRNAVEAAPEPGQSTSPTCCVRVGWHKIPGALEITITDDGPGIANPQNLFVPFFTTKPSGSGIGLVLCRQIAENHGGSLTLENRTDRPGCIARLRLPL